MDMCRTAAPACSPLRPDYIIDDISCSGCLADALITAHCNALCIFSLRCVHRVDASEILFFEAENADYGLKQAELARRNLGSH